MLLTASGFKSFPPFPLKPVVEHFLKEHPTVLYITAAFPFFQKSPWSKSIKEQKKDRKLDFLPSFLLSVFPATVLLLFLPLLRWREEERTSSLFARSFPSCYPRPHLGLPLTWTRETGSICQDLFMPLLLYCAVYGAQYFFAIKKVQNR